MYQIQMFGQLKDAYKTGYEKGARIQSIGSEINKIILPVLALIGGVIILFVGFMFLPLVAVFQANALASGSSGDPNLTGADRTTASFGLTIYVMLILVSALGMIIASLFGLFKQFKG